MLAPISWLKEYVDIKLKLADLMWKLTEVGLTCETYQNVGKDTVLNIEVTANRPDWMSIVGIAREIAAIQGTKIKFPEIKKPPNPRKTLPVELLNNYKLIERWSAIVIKDVKIAPSPDFIQKRLISIGLRPINNIVDITNYVMFELGIPMHAFDYNKIKENKMYVKEAKGGEEFNSVD